MCAPNHLTACTWDSRGQGCLKIADAGRPFVRAARILGGPGTRAVPRDRGARTLALARERTGDIATLMGREMGATRPRSRVPRRE